MCMVGPYICVLSLVYAIVTYIVSPDRAHIIRIWQNKISGSIHQMNQFSKLIHAEDKVVVGIKDSDNCFKSVNHFGSVLEISHVMMKNEIENNR